MNSQFIYRSRKMQRIVLSNSGNGSVDSILFRTEEKLFMLYTNLQQVYKVKSNNLQKQILQIYLVSDKIFEND
jgi:hypothetical protein